MNVGIGTEAAQFHSGNICFEFSVYCLCSARKVRHGVHNAHHAAAIVKLI